MMVLSHIKEIAKAKFLMFIILLLCEKNLFKKYIYLYTIIHFIYIKEVRYLVTPNVFELNTYVVTKSAALGHSL
jgi:hypothetical protein